jgi:hypothetical protein
LVASMLVAVSTSAYSETVHLNQLSLRHLQTMCSAVLAHVQPLAMMYVKTYTMNELINQTSGAVVGLDVTTVNPKGEQDVYTCHYDLEVTQAGDPRISKMLVDNLPVNINVITDEQATPASTNQPKQ